MTRVHHVDLGGGIRRTPEFEKKGLATHAVNVGLKCGHDCTYCSTGACVRCHRAFKDVGESPYEFGFAIIDPKIHEKVAGDARRTRKRGMVQICTTSMPGTRRRKNIIWAVDASKPFFRTRAGTSGFSRRTPP